MVLNRLFENIHETREAAHWRSAFGEPQTVGEQTIIPVARVSYGFGLGFGQAGPQGAEAPGEDAPDEAMAGGEGGGGGGGAMTRPVGALVVTPDGVYFEETASSEKVALAGVLLGALAVLQVGLTLREILRR
ncbi:MAG: spore germination protein GerW family protein [Anaerolineae bacterium]|jgi:uncharacterized spore protein YtfJ